MKFVWACGKCARPRVSPSWRYSRWHWVLVPIPPSSRCWTRRCCGSLPVSHPEQLVRLRFTGASPGHIDSYGGDDKDYFSYPMYRDLRDKNTVFDGILASDQCQAGVQWNNAPDLASCEMVSGNYFQVLGVQPAIGRVIVPSDDVPNSAPVVVLSFNYWKTKFGADPRVINQTLLINAHPFTIIGVSPRDFTAWSPGKRPRSLCQSWLNR